MAYVRLTLFSCFKYTGYNMGGHADLLEETRAISSLKTLGPWKKIDDVQIESFMV